MNTKVLVAVFRRNFVSYFSNPTGYVFICLFVFFGAIAAFWVPDFFGNNLANLDQLSYWLPFLMLVYIPTITMGIWADERKQGTDELLLTIPARDFDIVLGKYLAAVGIFSVSLLFSLVCNYLVLNNLASDDAWLALWPRLDFGLFLGTYLGYWLVGLAMLAIGAIASFLTSNITIGFVLGVLLNMPLVFLSSADAILGGAGRQAVLTVQRWSIAQRLSDLTHGVLSLSGVAYFAAILVAMLYVSMVLIGRRHWFTGRHRWLQAGHYVVRSLALAAVVLSAVVVFGNYDVRVDASAAKLSSLSDETVELVRDLKVDRPVEIEAFVSPSVPESYVQTRLNLLSALRELKAIGGARLQVQVHDTERYSDEAALAEKRYGIEPHAVTMFRHGAVSQEQIFLTVAVSCGTRKVPPVFIDRGIPVEYELVRSIATAAQPQQRRLGVLQTDAQLFGGFNMQAMSTIPNWPIIDELEKQYEVVKVDPSKPITEKYDVLLAVQPSSLGPEEMDNFIAAVAGGQPTAIFEDPAGSFFMPGVPATTAPRRSPGGMNPMFGGMQAPPKGEIGRLWKLLGVNFSAEQIVWQDYNPYPKFEQFPREFVFIGDGCGAKAPFGADPISAGLQQVLLPFPGAISKLNTSTLTFTPLAETGGRTGIVEYRDLMEPSMPWSPRQGLNPQRQQLPTNLSYVVAAHIQGKPAGEEQEGEKGPNAEKGKKGEKGANAEKGKKGKKGEINVVLVSDIDMIAPDFFRLREQGEVPEMGINFSFDNVTLVLNSLDELAGDQRFVEIRKRRPQHRTLLRIEELTKQARQETAEKRKQINSELEAEGKKEEQEIAEKLAELNKEKNIDIRQAAIRVAMMQKTLEQQREMKISQLRMDKDRKIKEIETELARKVRQVQDRYKMWAVLLPPIPPLLVAIGVFLTRRKREREGVARSRLR